MARRTLLALALIVTGSGAALAFGPFQDVLSGPRALPGDTLPPFAMKDDKGQLPPPPTLPPGAKLPQPFGPPETTAAGPGLAAATRMAQAAVEACTKEGFLVGATVIDSAGEARAMLSADGSGGSHVFVAMRKAEVALTFARASSEVGPLAAKDPAVLAQVTPAMFVEGGAVPLLRQGRVIGAIGVSGAAGVPIGHLDEVCAMAGAAALDK